MLTKELGENVIKEIHAMYGHIGVKRTYELFKEYFTGDHLYKFAKHLVLSLIHI